MSWTNLVPESFYCGKSVLGRVRNCMGERALCCETMASSYECQPNHTYTDLMFRLHSDCTRAIVVAGVLHSIWSELPHQGNTLKYYSLACGHVVIKSYTCTAFVWYLLHAMMPPSHNISAILMYRSNVLFLIHS